MPWCPPGLALYSEKKLWKFACTNDCSYKTTSSNKIIIQCIYIYFLKTLCLVCECDLNSKIPVLSLGQVNKKGRARAQILPLNCSMWAWILIFVYDIAIAWCSTLIRSITIFWPPCPCYGVLSAEVFQIHVLQKQNTCGMYVNTCFNIMYVYITLRSNELTPFKWNNQQTYNNVYF